VTEAFAAGFYKRITSQDGLYWRKENRWYLVRTRFKNLKRLAIPTQGIRFFEHMEELYGLSLGKGITSTATQACGKGAASMHRGPLRLFRDHEWGRVSNQRESRVLNPND